MLRIQDFKKKIDKDTEIKKDIKPMWQQLKIKNRYLELVHKLIKINKFLVFWC